MKDITTIYTCDYAKCKKIDVQEGTGAGRPDGWLTIHYTEDEDLPGPTSPWGPYSSGPVYRESHFCCYEHAALWCYARRGQDYHPVVLG